MLYRPGTGCCIGVLLVFLLLICALAVAETQMVKVVVKNATIRRTPEMTGAVAETPQVGSVFEVKGKSGRWYEIEFTSKVGIPVTGYIHETFVELTTEKPKPQKGRKRTMVRVGGLAGYTRAGYEYESSGILFGEVSNTVDNVDDGVAAGLGLGFGILVTDAVKITGDLGYSTKTLSGLFGFSLPNMYRYFDISYDEVETEPSLTEMTFTVGIDYNLTSKGPVRPYMGAGVSYINTKMEIVEDFTGVDDYSEIDSTHVLDIHEVVFAEKTISSVGLTLRGGVDVVFGQALLGFVEAAYVIAPGKELDHLIASVLYDEPDKLTIDLGGPRLTAGVKVLF